MSTLTQQTIENALRGFQDPYLQQDLINAKVVKNIQLQGLDLTIHIILGFPALHYQTVLQHTLSTHLKTHIPELAHITINVDYQIIRHAFQQGVPAIPSIKNILAIASGKGGVGKSTTAVNLALALQAEGAQVGILDADIYGANQPQMLGAELPEQTATETPSLLEPVISHGIPSMSIGYLIEPDTAMIWRGPMVSQALQQLLNNTQWPALDYLIIDLPPGTGDIQLTLAQKVPVCGVIMVTTPQDIALADVRKGIAMFNKVHVPVLGIVENMSTHICRQCGHAEAIFGQGGGARLAKQQGIILFGSLPLDISIRQWADGGKPSVIAEPESAIAHTYREIAKRIAARLSLQPKSYAHKFPSVTVQAS